MLLTGGLELLRAYRAERKERRHEIDRAVSELEAAASALIAYAITFPSGTVRPETSLAATQACLVELGRLQQATAPAGLWLLLLG